jgi:hypothetical protein
MFNKRDSPADKSPTYIVQLARGSVLSSVLWRDSPGGDAPPVHARSVLA